MMSQKDSKNLLATILSDGAVLQRNHPIKFWGWTAVNSPVKICFANKNYETVAQSEGSWELTLPPLPAGGPYQLTVCSHAKKLIINDLLIGDVWICGGQSNMELPMSRVKNAYPDEIDTRYNDNIRQFSVPLTFNFHEEQEDISPSAWMRVHPKHTAQFSAVGYFFAQKLHEQFKVPIGLIMTAVGGTPIAAWMSREALQPFPQELALANTCLDDVYVQRVQASDQQRTDAWHQALNQLDSGLQEQWFKADLDDRHWSKIKIDASWSEIPDLQASGSVWLRLHLEVPGELTHEPARLFMGCIVDADYIYVNGELVGHTAYQYPPREYRVTNLKPGHNLIAVRVIACHSTGGFVKDKPYKLVWKDTEISLNSAWKYKRGATCERLAPSTFFHYQPTGVYHSMIAPLHHYRIKGVIWYQGESDTYAPQNYHKKFQSLIIDWRAKWKQGDFPFLFVQLANFVPPKSADSNWAVLREQQRKSLTIPRTAMVVTIDIGEYNDLHPVNKKVVGERLALAAYRQAYGLNVVDSGPHLTRIEKTTNELILHFSSIGTGLVARGGNLKGFTICIKETEIPVQATIKEHVVVLEAPRIKEATAVKYAWANNPHDANLYNREGLPASPFEMKIK